MKLLIVTVATKLVSIKLLTVETGWSKKLAGKLYVLIDTSTVVIF